MWVLIKVIVVADVVDVVRK